MARLIDDRSDFDPHAWITQLPPMDLFDALLFQIVGQRLSVAATGRTLQRIRALFLRYAAIGAAATQFGVFCTARAESDQTKPNEESETTYDNEAIIRQAYHAAEGNVMDVAGFVGLFADDGVINLGHAGVEPLGLESYRGDKLGDLVVSVATY